MEKSQSSPSAKPSSAAASAPGASSAPSGDPHDLTAAAEKPTTAASDVGSCPGPAAVNAPAAQPPNAKAAPDASAGRGSPAAPAVQQTALPSATRPDNRGFITLTNVEESFHRVSASPPPDMQSTGSLITLNIATSTGGSYTVDVANGHSVITLKRIIAKKLKLSKDRMCLLFRERELLEGTLLENGLQHESRVMLVPTVETGLLAQRHENTVMQALESLNDTQVNDFLSGKTPLNLSMRLGDHMMLIQLQLSTISPVCKATATAPSAAGPAVASDATGSGPSASNARAANAKRPVASSPSDSPSKTASTRPTANANTLAPDNHAAEPVNVPATGHKAPANSANGQVPRMRWPTTTGLDTLEPQIFAAAPHNSQPTPKSSPPKASNSGRPILVARSGWRVQTKAPTAAPESPPVLPFKTEILEALAMNDSIIQSLSCLVKQPQPSSSTPNGAASPDGASSKAGTMCICRRLIVANNNARRVIQSSMRTPQEHLLMLQRTAQTQMAQLRQQAMRQRASANNTSAAPSTGCGSQHMHNMRRTRHSDFIQFMNAAQDGNVPTPQPPNRARNATDGDSDLPRKRPRPGMSHSQQKSPVSSDVPSENAQTGWPANAISSGDEQTGNQPLPFADDDTAWMDESACALHEASLSLTKTLHRLSQHMFGRNGVIRQAANNASAVAQSIASAKPTAAGPVKPSPPAATVIPAAPAAPAARSAPIPSAPAAPAARAAPAAATVPTAPAVPSSSAAPAASKVTKAPVAPTAATAPQMTSRKHVLSAKIPRNIATALSSASVITSGAVIDSMRNHGKGVYSGTFSGTLNPALQDRNGRPKRDISTVIHILNDLLSATPQYARAARKCFEPAAPTASKPKDRQATAQPPATAPRLQKPGVNPSPIPAAALPEPVRNAAPLRCCFKCLIILPSPKPLNEHVDVVPAKPAGDAATTAPVTLDCSCSRAMQFNAADATMTRQQFEAQKMRQKLLYEREVATALSIIRACSMSNGVLTIRPNGHQLCETCIASERENVQTKSKVDALRLVLQQKREHREARRLKAAPYAVVGSGSSAKTARIVAKLANETSVPAALPVVRMDSSDGNAAGADESSTTKLDRETEAAEPAIPAAVADATSSTGISRASAVGADAPMSSSANDSNAMSDAGQNSNAGNKGIAEEVDTAA